jgi:hypothetical protein
MCSAVQWDLGERMTVLARASNNSGGRLVPQFRESHSRDSPVEFGTEISFAREDQ